MPDFKYKSPGDSIAYSAGDWNAMVDAAKAHHARRAAVAGGGELPIDLAQALLVLARNDTGGDLDPFSVLAVATGTPVPDVPTDPHTARRLVMLPGSAPAGPDDAVVVTIDPIADGAIGRAVVAGVVPVKVQKAAAGDDTAAPAPGVTGHLAGGPGPVRLLWSEAGTGMKWAVALLGGAGGAGGVFHVFKYACGGGNNLVESALTMEIGAAGVTHVADSSCALTVGTVAGLAVAVSGTWTPGPRPYGAGFDMGGAGSWGGTLVEDDAARTIAGTYTYAAAGTYDVALGVTYGDGVAVADGPTAVTVS